MTATTENERHQTIRSIFESLDTNDPNASMNIRDAFQTVWDQLFALGECLESAASQFDGNRKRLLLDEYRRMQIMISILHESELPVIMPDENN